MPPIDPYSWELNAKYLIEGMEKSAITLELIFAQLEEIKKNLQITAIDINTLKTQKNQTKSWFYNLLLVLSGAAGVFAEHWIFKK